MVTLRLARGGTHKKPIYTLVAADQRAKRNGKFLEKLGYYNPARAQLILKRERVEFWLGVGAQMSDTAKRLIKKHAQKGDSPGGKEVELRLQELTNKKKASST